MLVCYRQNNYCILHINRKKMISHIRRFLSTLARKLIFRLKKQEEGMRKLPQWVFDSEPGPISDEIIKDRWDGNVLHCANNI